MPLTDVKIKNTKPTDRPIKLTDGHGLILEIKPNGSRFWRYRYRIDGKENMYAVGDYPAMTLAQARTARDAARELVKAGTHPAHQRQAERLATVDENKNTFKAVADEWVAKAKPNWTPYYLSQVERGLKVDIKCLVSLWPVRHPRLNGRKAGIRRFPNARQVRG